MKLSRLTGAVVIPIALAGAHVCAQSSGERGVAAGENILPNANTWFAGLSQAQGNSLLWIGDWETGDASQWDNGEPWISGPGDATWQVVSGPVHSGQFSVATTIDTTLGQAGVRWPRVDVPDSETLPAAAYYSTWLRVYEAFDAPWFNLMQWKHVTPDGLGSDPVWSINIGKHDDGRDYYYLYRYFGDDGQYDTNGAGRAADSPIAIPTDGWTHLEAYYRWAADKTGEIDVYQDGALIFHQAGVQTDYAYLDSVDRPLQWTINAFGESVVPTPSTIFFDDAAISGLRLGASSMDAIGDFNHNGAVDAADYTVCRNGVDAMLSAADFGVWKLHYGLSSLAGGASAIVPEPAAGMLMGAAGVGLFLVTRHRRRAF